MPERRPTEIGGPAISATAATSEATTKGRPDGVSAQSGADGLPVRNGAPGEETAQSGARENVPVRLGDEYDADIVGIGHEGEGVGRVNGFTLFVHGALPGERVRARVVRLKKQYGYAELVRVLRESPDRQTAPCPAFPECGGCQLQHLNVDAQLVWKRRIVIDNLRRIGKLTVREEEEAPESVVASGRGGEGDGAAAQGDTGGSGGPSSAPSACDEAAGEVVRAPSRQSQPASEASGGVDEREPGVPAHHAPAPSSEQAADSGVVVRPVIGMADPWRYRNKVQVPIGEREGGLVGGFYARASHRIVDTDQCLIRHEAGDAVVRRVKAAARELGISAYDPATHRGLLRHVIVKVGYRTGELMVVLVTNGTSIPNADRFVAAIREAVPGVASVCQNIHTARTNVVLGERTVTLWGRDVIYDYIGDIRFAISARSFYQVNPIQTEILYRKAVEYAGLTGRETVIDAYCGIGTISLFLAKHAKRVYGVEAVADAIADARRNAALNGIDNVEFTVGLAEEVLPAWKAQGIRADVIVVDPPRKGCDSALLDTIIAMRPERVVYVSCNPSTLARDLLILEDGGFRTVEVQPVDMFPHTAHVECVVLLMRE
jgi:23S rRNA (uracil1939-C5)-methyltransferase